MREFAVLLQKIITTQESLLTYPWLDDELRASTEELLRTAREELALIEEGSGA